MPVLLLYALELSTTVLKFSSICKTNTVLYLWNKITLWGISLISLLFVLLSLKGEPYLKEKRPYVILVSFTQMGKNSNAPWGLALSFP